MRIAWYSNLPVDPLLRLQRIPELCGEQSESPNCARQIRRPKKNSSHLSAALFSTSSVLVPWAALRAQPRYRQSVECPGSTMVSWGLSLVGG
jgi:hypothetical protein